MDTFSRLFLLQEFLFKIMASYAVDFGVFFDTVSTPKPLRSFLLVGDSVWEVFTKVCQEIPILSHITLLHPIILRTKNAV
jgi:hypothetical protein